MKEKDKKILALSIISTIIIVGNIFVPVYSWAHNPAWISTLITLVSLLSIFAWLVAIVLLTEEE